MFYGQAASTMWDQKLEENLDAEKLNRLLLQRNRIAGSIDVESMLPSDHYPLRPPIVTNSRYERIQADFLKLAELCERVSFVASEFNLPALSQRLGHGSYRPGSYASTHPLSLGLAQREIRPDFVVSNDQVKVLEMNFGAMTGGHPEVTMEALLYLDHEIPYEVSRTFPLYADSPIVRRVEYMKYLSRLLELKSKPNVAVIVEPFEKNTKIARTFSMLVAGNGLSVDILSHDEIEEEDGWASYRGKRYEIAIASFAEDLYRYKEPGYLEVFQAICKRGRTLVVGGERVFTLGSKGILAFLSESLGKNFLSKDEENLVETYIPWSRELKDDQVIYQSQVLSLCENGVKNRFVLKPAKGYGSRGVLIGLDTPQDQWNIILKASIESGGVIIQEYLQPDPIHLPFLNEETRALEYRSIVPVHSLFLINRKAGGIFTRFATTPHTRVINVRAGGSVPSLIQMDTVENLSGVTGR